MGKLCWRFLTLSTPQYARPPNPCAYPCKMSTRLAASYFNLKFEFLRSLHTIPVHLLLSSVAGVGTVPVGKIETGVLKPGMVLTFSPAKLTAEVKSIQMHHQGLETALPGHNVGFNIKNVAVKNLRRGDVAGNAVHDPPSDVSSFVAQVGMATIPRGRGGGGGMDSTLWVKSIYSVPSSGDYTEPPR